MAMAAVRFAARRLTGQQPQAILRSALANEPGVLNRGGSPPYALRRFTSSSEASAANGPKISTEHPSVSGDSRLMAADQKKEELFDLLDEIQTNEGIPYTGRKEDRWLLQRLTSHVRHRPSNPEWHRYLLEQRVGLCLGAISTSLAFLLMVEKGCIYFARNKQVKGADNNNKASVSCAEPIMEE